MPDNYSSSNLLQVKIWATAQWWHFWDYPYSTQHHWARQWSSSRILSSELASWGHYLRLHSPEAHSGMKSLKQEIDGERSLRREWGKLIMWAKAEPGCDNSWRLSPAWFLGAQSSCTPHPWSCFEARGPTSGHGVSLPGKADSIQPRVILWGLLALAATTQQLGMKRPGQKRRWCQDANSFAGEWKMTSP